MNSRRGCLDLVSKIFELFFGCSPAFPLANQYLAIMPPPPVWSQLAIFFATLCCSFFLVVYMRSFSRLQIGAHWPILIFAFDILAAAFYLFGEVNMFPMFAWLVYVVLFPLFGLAFAAAARVGPIEN